MQSLLTNDQIRDFSHRGFSRRNFGRIAALISAGSALPLMTEPALAQLSRMRGAIPADAVKIDANENPLGPSKEAAEAIHAIVAKGGRYVYEETDNFIETLAEQESLKPSYIRAYAGSSAPLTQAVIAFTGPAKPLVVADPGYEAAGNAARFIGAKVISVPLSKTYAHDVKGDGSGEPECGPDLRCQSQQPDRHRDIARRPRMAGGEQAEGLGDPARRGLHSHLGRPVRIRLRG